MKYKDNGYNRLLVGNLYSWDIFENQLIEDGFQNPEIAKI